MLTLRPGQRCFLSSYVMHFYYKIIYYIIYAGMVFTVYYFRKIINNESVKYGAVAIITEGNCFVQIDL